MTAIVKLLIFLFILGVVVAFLLSISSIVKLIIVSALFAYLLDPAVNFIESKGLSRASSTIILFLCLFLLIIIFYMIFHPVIVSEIDSLKEGLSLTHAETIISNLEKIIVSNLSFLGIKELNLFAKLKENILKIGDWFFTHFIDAASILTSIIIIPFIVFFLLKDGRDFKKAIIYMLPNKYFELSLYLLHKLNLQIGNYIRGQLIDAIIVGILAIFSLWLINLKYFFLIGAFAGLANLIPYFGPIAGALLAIIVSVFQTGDFRMAIYIILAFSIIKLLDDVLIQPLVVARSVHMNPAIVLLAILAGGKLFGILGMLLSVPITGFIIVIIRESIENYKRYKLRYGTFLIE